MIAVLSQTRNHFLETRESFESLYAQDAEFHHYVIDRGSIDAVSEYLDLLKEQTSWQPKSLIHLDYTGVETPTNVCINNLVEAALRHGGYTSFVFLMPYVEFAAADVIRRIGAVAEEAVCSPILNILQVGESIEFRGERLRLCGASQYCFGTPAEIWNTFRVPLEEQNWPELIKYYAKHDYDLPIGCVEGTRAYLVD